MAERAGNSSSGAEHRWQRKGERGGLGSGVAQAAKNQIAICAERAPARATSRWRHNALSNNKRTGKISPPNIMKKNIE